MPPQTQSVDPHFTVFIRLPFPRGDFVDPPPAYWNASKDRVLWDVLSQPSKENDVDWKALADHFDVTLPFLLQQVAWLYDRQLSQVRAQIRRVGSQQPLQGPTTSAGGTPGGAQPMTAGGSSGSRIPSRLSIRQRDSPAPRYDYSAPGTPVISKVSTRRSSAPRTESPKGIPTTQQRSSRRSSNETAHPTIRRESRTPAPPLLSPRPDEESSDPLSSSSSSSSSNSEAEDTNRRGAPFKRFGKFSIHNKPGSSYNEDDEEEEDSPAFLPLETPQENVNNQSHSDTSPTISNEARRATMKQNPATGQTISPNKPSVPESSTSSISSGMATGSPVDDGQRVSRHAGTLSPRRAAQLARLGPRGRGNRREGSDGTPSMGSSFSDLDDASVSQSALEEAFLSRHGGVASRMSTISQALRSRYL